MTVLATASTEWAFRVLNLELRWEQVKVDNLSDDSAEYYYKKRWQYDDTFKIDWEVTPYESLTNEQKLDVLWLETQYHLLNWAKSNYKDNTVSTAKNAADLEISTRY
jgi:hypothetical protein